MTSPRRASARCATTLTTVCVLTALPIAALAQRPPVGRDGSARPSLAAFESDSALVAYLGSLAAERRRIRADEQARWKAAVEAGLLQFGGDCANAVLVSHVAAPVPPGGVPSGAAVVRGRIRSEVGTPVNGAVVSIGAVGVSAMTSDSGEFRFAVPESKLHGSQTVALLVRRIGYSAKRVEVSLAPGDSVTAEVRLCTSAVMLEQSVTASLRGEAPGAESITNTQHAGVDEGGIVKTHGEHLVILRRGRLFTVRVGDRSLRSVDAVDAFAPGIDPTEDWYDELLISGDQVVVIGYSYRRGGTELGVFRIDRRGRLSHRATYHLRSSDYYSSRNYASRLIGTTLVFYTALVLPIEAEAEVLLASMPAVRVWSRDARDADFGPIISADRVYRPALDIDPMGSVTLHTITTCDLAAERLSCTAAGVIGPPGRVFFVSPSAVYVWVSDWPRRHWEEGIVVADTGARSTAVYRLPLDGSAPSALGASGSPVDQFSFLESDDGHLNVLVRQDAAGDGMWSAEFVRGRIALLRVPLSEFGDGSADAGAERYRELPAPDSVPRHHAFVNRFIGPYLLYGTGSRWWLPKDAASEVHVVPWRGGEIARLELAHGVDRIEGMGDDAVVVGARSAGLHFSGIRLGERPQIVQRYVLERASQGELRSHGFFYKTDGPAAGTLGIPVMAPGRPGYSHLFDETASMLFLRNTGREFETLGRLEPRTEQARDDGCRASCVDWYGDARPIFWRGRVFALLGYELVEGAMRQESIREVRRVDFAPRVPGTVGQ